MLSKNKIKYIRQLGQKKYRQREQQFIIEGEKMVTLAFKLGLKIKYCLFLDSIDVTGINPANYPNTIFEQVSKRDMEQLTQFKTHAYILAVVEMQPQLGLSTLPRDKGMKYVFVNDLQDPGNLGTILRTADWFGWDGVITGPNTVEYYNPKTVQSSMGSVFRYSPVSCSIDEILELKGSFHIVGTHTQGIHLNEIQLDKSKGVILILGSESHGIQEEQLKRCDSIVSIPGAEIKIAESLNVAMASAILLNKFSY